MTVAATSATLAVGAYPVPLDSIIVGHRLRRLDEQKVERLMESIELVGLLDAIKLDTAGGLVAGAHRLEAQRRRGETVIRADVQAYTSPAIRSLAEIDDNWQAAGLTALERAEHFAGRVECYRQLGKLARPEDTQFADKSRETPMESGPEVDFRAAEDRVTMASLASDWGVSDRQGRTWLRVARLPEPIRDLVSFTPVANSLKDLVWLGELEDEERLPVAEEIARGHLATVKAALRKLYPERFISDGPRETEWDDSDIPERLRIVGFTGTVSFIVPNDEPRTRPNGQVSPREAPLVPHEIELQWDVAVREEGMEGLRGVAGDIAKAIYSDTAIRRDWTRIP